MAHEVNKPRWTSAGDDMNTPHGDVLRKHDPHGKELTEEAQKASLDLFRLGLYGRVNIFSSQAEQDLMCAHEGMESVVRDLERFPEIQSEAVALAALIVQARERSRDDYIDSVNTYIEASEHSFWVCGDEGSPARLLSIALKEGDGILISVLEKADGTITHIEGVVTYYR